MPDPLVIAVMLTKGRPEMARFALRCFQAQTYPNRRLLILNTGGKHIGSTDPQVSEIWTAEWQRAPLSIGVLRNVANTHAKGDIIAHWDDDDYSAPWRLREQVRHLTLPDRTYRCTGYRTLPFFDERSGEAWMWEDTHGNCPPGTTLAYWRDAWRHCPFEDTSIGEDAKFTEAVETRTFGISVDERGLPAMAARIHAGNTSPFYRRELMEACAAQGDNWRRSPDLDGVLAGIFSPVARAAAV